MSSSKQKKSVHYERGTKGGKSSHSHRSSRDSGVGSSSASDRASIGAAHETSFSYQEIEHQRRILSSVQEALDAANDKIHQLEAANAKVNELLVESNKEKRLLRREKDDLIHQLDYLTDDLEDERKLTARLKRETSPRKLAASAPRPAASRRESDASRPSLRSNEERSRGSHAGERRSLYASPLPEAPPAPPNPHPNPFTPNPVSPQRASPPSVAMSNGYSQASVSYAPSTISYSPTPLYAVSSPTQQSKNSSSRYHNDGKYHLQPL